MFRILEATLWSQPHPLNATELHQLELDTQHKEDGCEVLQTQSNVVAMLSTIATVFVLKRRARKYFKVCSYWY